MLSSSPVAHLRQLTPAVPGISLVNQAIPPSFPTVIGRDSTCHIILDSQYKGVSKQHLEIRPIATSSQCGWEIQDLGSSNGTYINNVRLQGSHILKHGDRVRLGQHGPEFIFEYVTNAVIRRPGRAVVSPLGNSLGRSVLLPFLSKDLSKEFKKQYFLPGVITVLFVVFLFFSEANNPICQAATGLGLQASCYSTLLGFYLALVGFYVIYLLCGKPKPWWILLAAGATTFFLARWLVERPENVFVWFFGGISRSLFPATADNGSAGFIVTFTHMFFVAGLLEELLKAVPILLALYIGRQLKPPLREKVGVWEPMDGILLGAASAVGFTLLETLGVYVPQIVATSGETVGLMLVVPRVVGSIAGHIAYSGYFGYFIGLSVIKPRKRWKILSIGYFTSATIHALWNSVGTIAQSATGAIFLQSLIGIVSYVFLIAAIAKAKSISR